MAINISVQYNGGLLPDIILLTRGYYQWGTRLNTNSWIYGRRTTREYRGEKPPCAVSINDLYVWILELDYWNGLELE